LLRWLEDAGPGSKPAGGPSDVGRPDRARGALTVRLQVGDSTWNCHALGGRRFRGSLSGSRPWS